MRIWPAPTQYEVDKLTNSHSLVSQGYLDRTQHNQIDLARHHGIADFSARKTRSLRPPREGDGVLPDVLERL